MHFIINYSLCDALHCLTLTTIIKMTILNVPRVPQKEEFTRCLKLKLIWEYYNTDTVSQVLVHVSILKVGLANSRCMN